jgi:cytochrome c oxidase subunit II
MSTVIARSDFARAILDVYTLITWVTAIIAVVVFGLLGWVLLRYRERDRARLPRQIRGHTVLEISWTVVPALIVILIAIPTIHVTFRTQAATVPREALPVTVLGYQWWWEFRYPSLGIVTANELHIPSGRPVVINLEGPDVIHSFWVPQLGGKRDVVPGRQNRITLTADTPGEYWGQCAEFCGTSHANMRLRVIVDSPAAFEQWVAGQRRPPEIPSGPAADGKSVYTANVCVGCHTIEGVSTGLLGPNLTHFGSRTTLGAGLYPNTLENVAAWVKDAAAAKPGAKMPAVTLTDEQAHALAAYLLSLK